ncbi:MAG TPA: OsmC family protein [Burkholderiales bacterium]|nr:OsmC family protein [Burkholderiales bacterium]
MSTDLKQVFSQNKAGLTQHPEQGLVTFQAESRGLGGLHRRVSIRDFSVEVDEPPLLGGSDQAANPVEYALAALATCQEITYRLHAAELGIPLTDVSVKLEGDLDLRGFFGAADGVRSGFTEIRGQVRFDSPASPEQLERLKDVVDAHCPVLDLFRNPTPVKLQVAEFGRPGAVREIAA